MGRIHNIYWDLKGSTMRAGTLGRVQNQGRLDRAMTRVVVAFRVALAVMAAAAVIYRLAGF